MISFRDIPAVTTTRRKLACAAAIMLAFALIVPARAQQQPAPAAPATPTTPAPAPAAPAQTPPQYQASGDWGRLPKMEIERQYAGPLQDTLVQRLRDPVDGTVCYLYLPISVQHSLPTSNGFVQYGPNTVGSISCLPGVASRPTARAPAR